MTATQPMTKLEMDELRNRWSPKQVQSINRQLVTGKLEQIVAPKIQVLDRMLVDLRGLPITEMIRSLSVENVSFSYCTMEAPGQFIDMTFRGCEFVGATLDTNFSKEAIDCDFSNAVLCKWLGDRFERCSFVNADFTRLNTKNVSFINCDFTESNWRKATVLHSTFDSCIWDRARFRSGSFCWSRFVGTRPDTIALGNTMMDDVIFE